MMVGDGSSTPLTVTFDTNTLDSVISPHTTQRAGERESAAIVHAALKTDRILGFFSEALITIEGIRKRQRSEILGKTRVFVATSADDSSEHAVGLRFSVGMRHAVRPALDSQASARVQGALDLGMQTLWTPARIGHSHVDPQTYPMFRYDEGLPTFTRYMDDVNTMAANIEARGVGRSVAVELGRRFSTRDGVDTPELWLQGLGRTRTNAERQKVAAAISEWADGDSIAAHYGFGIQLFCSEDFGRASKGRSVLDDENRKWLTDSFGISFVRLRDLAQRVV